MKFLLDTDICSAHMRRPAKLSHRFIQHIGQIAISSVTLAELYAGAYKHPHANRLLAMIADLMRELRVVDFDSDCAEKIRAGARKPVATGDLRSDDGLDDRLRSSGS